MVDCPELLKKTIKENTVTKEDLTKVYLHAVIWGNTDIFYRLKKMAGPLLGEWEQVIENHKHKIKPIYLRRVQFTGSHEQNKNTDTVSLIDKAIFSNDLDLVKFSQRIMSCAIENDIDYIRKSFPPSTSYGSFNVDRLLSRPTARIIRYLIKKGCELKEPIDSNLRGPYEWFINETLID